MMSKLSRATPLALALLVSINTEASAQLARAELTDANGRSVGTVTLRQTAQGVLLTTDLKNIPAGWHGFHIHDVGKCKPSFKAAGLHFNPTGRKHGLTNPTGAHTGDLPNVYAGQDGVVKAQMLNSRITLGKERGTIFDQNGSSFIIHERPDTHGANPGAGSRIACGVIQQP